MRNCSKSGFLESSTRQAAGLVVLLLLVSAFTDVRADIVRLKSGRAINGQVRGEEDGRLIVRTLGGEEKIPSDEITGIEVGYTGLSFCVVKKGEKDKDCSGVLHLIQKEFVVLGTGEALTQRKELRKGDFVRVEFRKAADGQQILPVLTTGIELEVVVKSTAPEGETTLKGMVVGSDQELMILKLPDGTVREFTERDLIGGVFTPKMSKARPSNASGPPFLVKFIPGAYQFADGKYIRGTIFTIGYMGAAAGFAVAYSRARAAERDASNSLSYWLFYDQQYQTKFRYYQRVERAIGGAALLMYGLHLIDAFWVGSSDDTAAGPYSSPILSYGNPARRPLGVSSDQVEIVRLTFRF